MEEETQYQRIKSQKMLDGLIDKQGLLCLQ